VPATRGWRRLDKVLLETLSGFKRAGCDGILTYGADGRCQAAQVEMIERPSARLILLDRRIASPFNVHDPRCSIRPIPTTTVLGPDRRLCRSGEDFADAAVREAYEEPGCK